MAPRHTQHNGPVGVKDRQLCTSCGTTESMNHILFLCQSRPTQLIWILTREVWPHDDILWPEIDLGTVLGCSCISPQPSQPSSTRHKLMHPGCLPPPPNPPLQVSLLDMGAAMQEGDPGKGAQLSRN